MTRPQPPLRPAMLAKAIIERLKLTGHLVFPTAMDSDADGRVTQYEVEIRRRDGSGESLWLDLDCVSSTAEMRCGEDSSTSFRLPLQDPTLLPVMDGYIHRHLSD